MKVRLDQEITIKSQDGEQLFLRAPTALKTLLGIAVTPIHHGRLPETSYGVHATCSMNRVDFTVKGACTYVGFDVGVSMLEHRAVTRFRRYGATLLHCMPLCYPIPTGVQYDRHKTWILHWRLRAVDTYRVSDSANPVNMELTMKRN